MLNELVHSVMPVCGRSRLTLLALAIAAGNISAQTLQPSRPIEPAPTALRAPASVLRAPAPAPATATSTAPATVPASTGATFKPKTATALPALSMAGIGYVAASAQPPSGGTAAPAFKPKIVTAAPPLSMVGIGK